MSRSIRSLSDLTLVPGGGVETYPGHSSVISTLWPDSKLTAKGYTFIGPFITNTRTSSGSVGQRGAHSAVAYDNKLWAMGGFDGSIWKNDVRYSSDGISWSQATAAAAWSARSDFRACVHDSKMWVMGGYTGSVRTKHVYYSTDGVTWTQATSAAAWSARYKFAGAVHNSKMWVMGGDDTADLNDVWYSTDGVSWTQATAAAGWSAREELKATSDGTLIWMCGGYSNKRDVWYSSDGVTWTQATATANWQGRGSHGFIYHDSKLWVVCGTGSSAEYARNVWVSEDGVTWYESSFKSLSTGSALWSLRVYSYDVVALSGKLWILGGTYLSGSGSAGYLGDAWEMAIAYKYDAG